MSSFLKTKSAASWLAITLSIAIAGWASIAQDAKADNQSSNHRLQSKAASGPAHAYVGIGRPATSREIAAWDIDVRPDLKGLPKGSGSVEQGMSLWETKCASCHGVFGESNQVFSPLAGGTTVADIKSGKVARLTDPGFPGRTTLMKVPTISTLWDYINRAMPWNAPKSLTADEVYAATAFLLNLGGIVPDDFILSDRNMAQAQSLLPNRNGMTTDHGLWPGKAIGNRGKPDVQVVACMKDCAAEPSVASLLPDFARNSHGNLADQNRTVGAQHGVNTVKPPLDSPRDSKHNIADLPTSDASSNSVSTPPGQAARNTKALALASKNSCLGCHGVENRIVGPSFREVSKKYADLKDSVSYLASKIRAGGSGLWGAIPMPAQSISEADARELAQWIALGAPK
ncbi:MAG: cytochrome C [Betaproteobacteria bacterium]|nr:cytochrome C [Betaproteobacteria bacterium]